jgi:hypothetical protein
LVAVIHTDLNISVDGFDLGSSGERALALHRTER